LPADIRRGAILSGYRLDRLVGGGGSAAVWLAYDVQTEQRVALKLLHPELLKEPRALARAQREAELLTRLRHPALAHCLGAHFDDDPPYLVIDYIEGRTLAGVLVSLTGQGRGLALPIALSILEQVASAVDHAHGAGVVHRDLKPANVMLSGNLGAPQVTVLDLGVAKILAPDGDDPTTWGRLLGTYAYMSPEQAKGEAIDGRSDVFSLAVLFFEMVTRRRPWLYDPQGGLQAFGDSIVASTNPPLEVMRRIGSGQRPKLREHRPELPAALDEVLEQAWSVDREERPPTAGALAQALSRAAGATMPEVDPTKLAAVPRSGTPLYATVQVESPTLPVEVPTPTHAGPVVKVSSPLSARRRGIVAALAFAGLTAFLGWWIGMRMGAARSPNPIAAPAPPPAAAVAEPTPTPTPAPAPTVQAAATAQPIAIEVAPTPEPPPPPPAAALPKATRSTAPRTKAPASALEPLNKLMAAIEADPNASDRHQELARGIEVAAAGIEDDVTRNRIVRIAKSSALVGDVEGLRRALENLRAAQGTRP
jgi:serine/threonine protein kinase